MKQSFCLLLLAICFAASAQQNITEQGKSYKITSKYNMFPDSVRNASPRIYDGKTYAAKEHYSDSSAYIFVPDYFDKTKAFQFVFWFHGWGNNIDTALAQYKLQQQFYDAHLNAIFVFPEGPKNAPDSYAGKFEKADSFNHFMNDVYGFLLKEKILRTHVPYELILAGHSGAYRAIAYLLLHASTACKGILLFDALYAEQEKFTMHLQQHPNTKLINIFTDEGGTYQNSKGLIADMTVWKWNYLEKEEDDCTADDLKNNRILFLHSKKKHNDVIANQNNFQRFLASMK